MGGGWGYGGGSADAIAFTVDTEVLLGGIGLYGSGSSEFVANVELILESSPSHPLVSMSGVSFNTEGGGIGDPSDNWYACTCSPSPLLPLLFYLTFTYLCKCIFSSFFYCSYCCLSLNCMREGFAGVSFSVYLIPCLQVPHHVS